MKRLEHVPAILAAALLGVLSVLLWAQLVLGAVDHGKQMKLCAAVYGVTQPPSAAFTARNVLNGIWQRALAQRIGYSEPYFPLAVHVRNQVEYSVFDVLPPAGITLGARHNLLQNAYIDDYCSRDVKKFLVGAPGWAAKIKQMQDNVEARGQIFLYVITPSKVAMYPELLPPGLPCPSSQADRTGLVPAWVAVVKAAGVHVLNTIDVLNAAQADYPFALYPQGGTHWNDVGSALATQAVEANLESRRHQGLYKPFTFTWRSAKPAGSYIDLAMLLNLMTPPTNFMAPRITIQPGPETNCHPLRIVIVGGSFMQHIGPKLSAVSCQPLVIEYFYWQKNRSVWEHGAQHLETIVPAQRDRDLLHADVVIYEENEQLLGHSLHGMALYQWSLRHPAG